ncbi:MAG: M14 family metallopeptidase [Thermoanaerobaculia bacterium]
MRSIVALLLVLLAFPLAAAPAPATFLGWEIGARFTPHHRIVDYFEALAAARPERISLERFGTTIEQRPLVYAVITSDANRSRLSEIRRAVVSLSDPRGLSDSEAESIVENMPAIVWLAFGVHGDEASSAEAAMLVADRLMKGDDEIRGILEHTVVIIDPLQNPDGRQRYVNWFEGRVGAKPDPDPEALEHHQPWPGGRFNHYLVDMNRDWLWTSQPESQARVRAYLQWKPQVFVDFHEMWHDSNYFFPPDADPINANIDPDTSEWLDAFGRANAEAFSSRGWPFFVGEHFDLFYPGYGDSWPSFQGAVGMTYEMAGHGFAGRAVEREDGSILTLADRAERHFTAAMATLRTASTNRRQLLAHTLGVVRRQIEAPQISWLIPPGSPNLPAALAMLERQSIELQQLVSSRRIEARPVADRGPVRSEFPAGTVVISSRQPMGALVRTLFEKTPELNRAFIEAQRSLVDADEPDQFYDITAWSLPLAFNLDAWATGVNIPSAALARWSPAAPPAPPVEARFGWIVDARDPEVYRLAGELLRREIHFSVIDVELNHGGRTFARGSLLVQKNNNSSEVLGALVESHLSAPATFVAVDSGWSGGLALGSSKVHYVRDPQIAIVGGEGVSPTSYGHLWHTFDREIRIPYTALGSNRLGAADLSKFRVLILPDGTGWDQSLGQPTLDRLAAWVEGGNTLIAIGRSARALRGGDKPFSKTRVWEPEKTDDDEDSAPSRYHDFGVPGAAFRTVMNERNWLTFGLDQAPAVLISGSDALLPVSYGVDNILRLPETDPLVAGFAWPESIERLEGSAWLVVEKKGRGKVITFAGEPYFRSFWRGTLPILLNAALYSPSF